MGKTSDTYLKEITITPEDLKEIEESQPQLANAVLSSEQVTVLDFMKQRKFVTYDLVAKKMGVKKRMARNWLDTLREMGLIGRQYALIKSFDSAHRKTALHFIIDNKPKKNKRKT